MFCTKCGNQIKDGYKFCPKCGTPAYVEKEDPKGEVKKEEVDKVTKGANVSVDSEPDDKSSEKVKKNTKTKTKSTTKEGHVDSKFMNNFIPNPLIAEALDIEGVKKKAEEGDKVAIFKQAFRCKIGIGVERDLEKAEKLYEICGGDVGDYVQSTSDYLLVNILSQNLCINKD